MNTSRLSVALGLPGRLNATHYRQINCPGKSPNVCACHDTLRYPQGSWVLTWTSRRIQRYLSKHINTQADIPGEWWVNVSLRLSSYNSYMCYQTNRHIDKQPNGCVGWGSPTGLHLGKYHTNLRYLYSNAVFPFYAALELYSSTSRRLTLRFLFQHICLTALATSYFSDYSFSYYSHPVKTQHDLGGWRINSTQLSRTFHMTCLYSSSFSFSTFLDVKERTESGEHHQATFMVMVYWPSLSWWP